MELDYETFNIYEVYWKERCYLTALSENEAVKKLKKHRAYGELDDDNDDAIGTKWAEDNSEEGWRVVPRSIKAFKIFGEVKGSFELEETVHLIWQCPQCEQYFSEDVKEDTNYPMLLICSCKKPPKETFYLVDINKKRRYTE